MNSEVFLAACPDYGQAEAAVERALAALGGPERFLAKGRRVLVKPNLLMARAPQTATTAHPAVVAAVAAAFVRAGAEVTIADSPGGPFNAPYLAQVYRACGMDEAAARSGARLNTDCSHRDVRFRTRSFRLMTPVAEADAVISVGKAKTHMLTYFTGAAKNLYGCVAGLEKAAWHSRLPDAERFCAMLTDLAECVAPALSFVDAVEGMDGKGPSGGRVRQVGLLAASENPFAADLAVMDAVGLDPQRAPLHREAVRRGLVPERAAALTLRGDPVAPLAEPFVPSARRRTSHSMLGYLPRPLRVPLQRLLLPFPRFGDRCVGCGRCAAACPRGAIAVRDGRAVLDKKKCIQCYCCHELCPARAVEL